MIKGSDLFVAALENEGVERIFGVPGEENLDTVESLRNSNIDLVLTRHEQSAAFMAATYGRLTGRPGVCMSTLGPGALNLATGAAYAHLGAMPMILITGQKAILSSQQARFPDRRRGGVDETADQAVPADRQRLQHSRRGAGRLPGRHRGTAGPGASGAARRRRRRADVPVGSGPAAPGRPAGGEFRGAQTRRRPDQPGGTTTGDARGGGQSTSIG